tara:strand:+ start:4556 stop:5011 length:456 start_codon:yes stop_codon:yes gene_type:complete
MEFIGLDTSSFAIHAVVINEKEEITGMYKWECDRKANYFDRFPELLENFRLGLDDIESKYAALEDSVPVGARSNNMTKLSRVVGAVWAFLIHANIETSFVPHGTWKKNVLGRGNAKKDDIMKYVVEKWGDKFPEQDYADAACLALWNKRRF